MARKKIAQNVLATYPRNVPLIQESRTQLQYYTNSLSSCISHDLGNTLLTKLQFQRLVNWLLRLDKGEEVCLARLTLDTQ